MASFSMMMAFAEFAILTSAINLSSDRAKNVEETVPDTVVSMRADHLAAEDPARIRVLDPDGLDPEAVAATMGKPDHQRPNRPGPPTLPRYQLGEACRFTSAPRL